MKKYLLYMICFIILTSRLNSEEISINDPSVQSNNNNQSSFIGNSLSTEFSYKGEIWNISKGIGNKSFVYVDNFDLIFGLDMEKLIGLHGGNVNVYILGNNGFEPNDYINSVHGVSNIAAPKSWKIYTAHYEQFLFDEKFSILVGMYDYNSEFDNKPSSGIFINPSQGIGADISQTGENGPSIFPTASLGVRLKSNPFEKYYVQLVALDGIPGNPDSDYDAGIFLRQDDGLFVGAETGFDNSNEETTELKAGIGYWYYTDKYSKIATGIRNKGVYAFIDKRLMSENDTEGLNGFLRFGYADREKNSIGFFAACGLVYSGLFPGMESDISAISLASCRLYGEFNCLSNIIELTHQFNLSDYIYIQPNLQIFIHPDDKNQTAGFFVAGIRTGLKI